MGLPAKKEQFQFQVERSEMGKADTLRYNVISFVVEGQYDRAVSELKNFAGKDSEYPRFQEKTERYVSHAVDLVNAIRAKRNFPGAQYLTMAKQQELNERFREHYSELQVVLKRIEKIHIDLKLEDSRSTVWVVRALVHSAFAILLVAFMIEATSGLMGTAHYVVDDGLNQTINWFFDKIGW
ncbi:MAG: hypothetical protein KF681_14035 [Bdellovibrionaceae bacterium]|nr:hypothetical protein [Pseudobdellovibrionaceae bacterium]